MDITRCVQWSKEAAEFFEKAEDNGLELTIPISHKCISQFGGGFQELVASLNENRIKQKIKLVRILDASYLYRYVVPEFLQFYSRDFPSIWLQNHKIFVEALEVKFFIEFWAEQIRGETFSRWEKLINEDFEQDNAFRDIVIKEANLALTKSNGTIEGNVKFLLEEYAHYCAWLKNAIIVYPLPPLEGLLYINNKYSLNIFCCIYKKSNFARRHCKIPILRK